MKTIMKTLLVSIASLSLMFSVNAGELTVSGTAKATYNAGAGNTVDQGLGITNELNFTASGEMDNGYTWSYSMELDPGSSATDANGQANNDDTQIVLGLNDLGTVKVCVSECGNNKKYAWDASAYTSMSDTGQSYGILYPGDSGAAGTSTIQYHTPELPFATKLSVAYNTNMSSDGASGNNTGSSGNSRDEYSLVSSPVDGLTLSAQYNSVNDYDDGVTTEQQQEEGGAYAAKYSAGNVTVGYGKSFQAPELTAVVTTGALRAETEYVENTGMSVGFAVNDDLSLSYTRETSERNMAHSPTVTYDIEMDSIQVAYSMGGATVSIARADVENTNYIQNYDVEETIIAMSFAF
jgi:outer membrane protein OmpU